MKLKTVVQTLGTFKSARNMRTRGRNLTPKQIIIEFDNGSMFKSYDSIIAIKDNSDTVFLTGAWNYSRTTGKYRNEFLNCGLDDCRRRLDSGEYLFIEESTL
jgi:hypothetical protein